MSNSFFPDEQPVRRLSDYQDLFDEPDYGDAPDAGEQGQQELNDYDALRAQVAELRAQLDRRDVEVEQMATETVDTIREVTAVALAQIGRVEREARMIQRHNIVVGFLGSFIAGMSGSMGAVVGMRGRSAMYGSGRRSAAGTKPSKRG